jgi:hypothetical protein
VLFGTLKTMGCIAKKTGLHIATGFAARQIDSAADAADHFLVRKVAARAYASMLHNLHNPPPQAPQ